MTSEQSLDQDKVFRGRTKAGWILLAKAAGWYALSWIGAFIAFMLVMFFAMSSKPVEMNFAVLMSCFLIVPAAMLQIWFAVRNARKLSGDHNVGLMNVAHNKQRTTWLIAGLLVINAVVWVLLQEDPSIQMPRFRELDPLIYVASMLCMGVAMSVATALFLYGWLWTALESHWGLLKTAATVIAGQAITFTLLSFPLNSAPTPSAMLQIIIAIASLTYVRYASQSVRPVVFISVIHSIAGSLATIRFFLS